MTDLPYDVYAQAERVHAPELTICTYGAGQMVNANAPALASTIEMAALVPSRVAGIHVWPSSYDTLTVMVVPAFVSTPMVSRFGFPNCGEPRLAILGVPLLPD